LPSSRGPSAGEGQAPSSDFLLRRHSEFARREQQRPGEAVGCEPGLNLGAERGSDHLLADDIGKTRINPGYSLIGRLKGLAELRGIMRAVERFGLA